MGLTKEEYESLNEKDKAEADKRVERVYLEAGADHVIRDIRGVLDLVR